MKIVDYIKNHKILAVIVAVLLVIIIATIISVAIQNNESSEPPESNTATSNKNEGIGNSTYGPTLIIKNWSDDVENIPSNEKDDIEATLYDTLIKNLPTGQNIPSDIDPEIRSGSYDQTYDPETQIYYTNFLIDIPSVKQTYRVLNQYSNLPPETSGLFDYTTMVYCPTASELIWPAFDCIDRQKIELEQ